MSKEEIYYKFILPNNSNIKTASVIALRDASHLENGHVIAYDQLNSTVKGYIDQYIAIPKYFDVRNYWDTDTLQGGGLSIIVSYSPEVNTDAYGWTKFTSGDKTVYCSIIVSSGEFFYNWNLPEEVLVKSNLRDSIVKSKFHKSWYFTMQDRTEYHNAGNQYVEVGREKYVFNKKYFKNGVPYGHRNIVLYYDHFRDGLGNIYKISDVQYKPNGEERQNWPFFTLEKEGIFYVSNTSTVVTRYRYETEEVSSGYSGSSSRYYITESGNQLEVWPEYFAEKYRDIQEDLKLDFIDLEVTRRILYNYQNIPSQISLNQYSDAIPTVVSGTGQDTVLSYAPPQEYITRPPMPLKYNLLRDALNDRDPYGDCEAVLAMWVADRDPKNVSDGNIAELRGLGWKQYAVPISLRCCLTDGSYNNKRFLISYPHKDSTYRYHIRHTSEYDKLHFKEALFLQNLIEYSRDYVVSFQNLSYTTANYSSIFDAQKHLFTYNNTAFKELYIRKQYSSSTNNFQHQNCYILVDHNLYTINSSLRVCVADATNTNSIFVPSTKILQSDYEKWNVGENAWSISDSWFIALFDATNISKKTGTLKLVNASVLKSFLSSKVPQYNWEDIYLSSFGILPTYNWSNSDSLLWGLGDPHCVPIGFLDNHISINNVTYGTNVNHKAIVGFRDVFDYTFSDYHHLKYNSANDTYELVVNSNKLTQYTAYVADV